MSVRQGIVSGAKWALVAKWYNRVIGLMSTLVLLRLLDVADFGIVALATFFVSLFAALSQAGAIRYILVKDNLTPDQISSVWSLNIAIRGVFTLLLMGCAGWIANYTNAPEMRWVLIVVSLNLVISALRNVGLDLEEKAFNFRQLTLTTMIAKTVSTAVSISLALMWESYWALIVGNLVMSVVEVASGYWLCRYRPYWCSKYWKAQWGFSKWTVATSIFGYLRSRIDVLLLGNLASTRDVGLYTTAQEFSWLPMTEIVFPLQRGLLAGYSSVKSEFEKLRDIACNQLSLYAAILLPSVFGIYAVAEPFVHVVLGENWLDAIPVVEHVSWLMIASIFYLPLIPCLVALQRFKLLIILDSVIIGLVLVGFYWYQDSGIEGLSFVRAVIAGLFSMLLVMVYKIVIGIPLRFMLLLSVNVLVPSLLMFGIVNWCTQLPYAYTPVLILSVIVGVSVYLPLLILVSYAMRHQQGYLWQQNVAVVRGISHFLAKWQWRVQ
jgi:O-antigen/teichoic acid export membrane protein